MSLLQRNFEEKQSLMKNDFAELQRQENEIRFTEDFIRRQAHDCEPIEFLQMYDCY